MTHWRHILHCLFLLVLAAGSAGAENAGDPLTIVASTSDSVIENAPWFSPESHLRRSKIYDLAQIADSSNNAVTESAGRCCDTIANTELEAALIDEEGLGRVSGGTIFFAIPDVVSQRTSAIKLWDEGRSRSCVSYDQGNGKISSSISFQRR